MLLVFGACCMCCVSSLVPLLSTTHTTKTFFQFLTLNTIFFQALQSCFFPLRHFGHFLLRHFGHSDISVNCLTVVSKLAITVFFQPIFSETVTEMTYFVQSFHNHFGLRPKKASCKAIKLRKKLRIKAFTFFRCQSQNRHK